MLDAHRGTVSQRSDKARNFCPTSLPATFAIKMVDGVESVAHCASRASSSARATHPSRTKSKPSCSAHFTRLLPASTARIKVGSTVVGILKPCRADSVPRHRICATLRAYATAKRRPRRYLAPGLLLRNCQAYARAPFYPGTHAAGPTLLEM